MLLNGYLRGGLRRQFGKVSLPPIVNVGHHDSHAAVFFASPFEEALVLVMDGYGDDASSSAYVGRGNRLERHWSTGIFNSLGLVYTFVTQHLGFARFGDEGKVMALAAFGDASSSRRSATPARATSRSPTSIATSRSPCKPSARRSSSTSCAPSLANSRSATS